MKKNRFLSLILSVIMLCSIVFPTAVYAEGGFMKSIQVTTGAEEQPAAPAEQEQPAAPAEQEQPAAPAEEEQPAAPAEEEQPAAPAEEEQPAAPAEEEQPAAPAEEEQPAAPAEEEQPAAPAEEEQPAAPAAENAAFEEGYVRVKAGASIYETDSTEKAIGSFTENANVYAVVVSRAANEAYNWLKITFDTAEAKAADAALLTGYVMFKDASVLSEAAAESLVESLKADGTVRSAGDILIPAVSFKAIEAEEQVIVEEVEEENVTEEAADATTIVITKQPTNITANTGAKASFEVEATGVSAYQWQYLNKGEWTNATATGNKTAKMTVSKVTSTHYKLDYRCMLTGNDGSIKYTNIVKILKATGVTITEQPKDVTAGLGEKVKFSVVAANVAAYQWQCLKNGAWENLSLTSAKKATVTGIPVIEARYAYDYRCQLTGDDGSITYTNTVKILKPGVSIIEITKQPANITANTGAKVSFEVEATGVSAYQWQYLNNGEWINATATGNKTAKMTVSKVTSTHYKLDYRCMLTGNDGSVEYTNIVKIVKPTGVTITEQPKDVTAGLGNKVSFAVKATGVKTYQWQCLKDGAWVNISTTSGKTATLTGFAVTEARYAYDYRCKLTGNDSKVTYTNTVKILKPIVSGVTITKQPTDIVADVGDKVTFKVEATGVATYQWQYLRSGKWVNATGTGNNTATMTNYTVTSSHYSLSFRCKLIGNDGSENYTDTFKIYPHLSITTQPADIEAEVGAKATFKVVAKGVKSYQWEYLRSGKWSNASGTGNATAKMTIAKVTATHYTLSYRCKLIGYDGTVDYTEIVKIVEPAHGIVLNHVTYEKLSDTTCKVVSYDGTEADLVIPTTVQELTVVEIGEEAFMGKAFLTSIDLPNTITVIRARAFKNCTNLSEMKNH